MGTLNSQQATELADIFSKMGDAIKDHYLANLDILGPAERNELSSQMMEMWAKSSSMYSLSAALVLEDLDDSLQKIREIQSAIGATLKNLANIQKAIDITGAAVALAASLLSKDPKVIGTSIEGLTSKIAEVKTNG